MPRPKKFADRNERRIYERDRARKIRADLIEKGMYVAGAGHTGEGVQETMRKRADAEYDPNRDGPPVWSDPYAALLGDPPIGRRALDQKVRP